MNQHIGHISLIVKDYDEAIAFYIEKLQFELIDDIDQGNGKRWVLIAPKGASNFSLLLAKANTEEQLSWIGNQTGGRVFLFLYTSDIESYYRLLKQNNVELIKEITTAPYGKVAVFADLYGNKWDLIEAAK